MIEIVTDKKLITKYQTQLIKQLIEFCKEKINGTIGYHGYSGGATIHYSDKYKFWISSQKNKNRYWNGFGLNRPAETGSNSIVVEINFPYEGRNRRVGGVFGQDKKGNVYVLHSGKIGGGRPGIGKELFQNNYWDDPITVEDDGVENELYVIGKLNAKQLPQEIVDFIIEVDRIKNLTEDEIEESNQFSFLDDFSFTDESTGVSKSNRNRTIVINRTHGFVVNRLKELLEEEEYQIGKNKNIDLFIHDKGKIKTIFEVKRSSSSQSLYAGVGQLLIYSMPVKTKVDLILVLPDKLKKTIENRLKKLGIQVLYYDYNNSKPIFHKLEDFI